MTALRILFGTLFVCGCFFATFSWILIPMPLGIFLPQYQYTSRDVALSLAGCGLALTGYFLWANWLLFAIRGKFIARSGAGMQILAFVNHLGWLVFLPFFREEYVWEFVANLPLVALWIFANLFVASVTGYILATADNTLGAC